jgi:hypothetical protein
VIARIAFPCMCLFVAALAARAEAPPLLQRAVEDWLGERDHWAFTQRAVEYDNDKPRERLERYDPSQTGDRRWTLLAIDGQPPTPEQHAAWAKKKFKKNRRRFDQPISEYFDFAKAKVLEDAANLVKYEVPLRTDKSWLFPIEKVYVTVTINKQTEALEHLTANVREPFKVLLGVARILGGDVDLNFLNFDSDVAPDPESTQPVGTARVTATRFGERVEFTWSDFKRVPAEAIAPAPTPDRKNGDKRGR